MTGYDDGRRSDGARHLSLDTLADLLAGEGSAAAVTHLEACSRCAQELAELAEAQAPVVAALRMLPVPPVPADLTARLNAALAAAGPLPSPPGPQRAGGPLTRDDGRDTDRPDTDRPNTDRPNTDRPNTDRPNTDRPGSAQAPGPATPPAAIAAAATVTPSARPRRPAGWLPAAAAAVLVLGAAALGLGQLDLGGGSAAQTSSDPGGRAAAAAADEVLAGVAVNASGRDYGSEPGALAQSLPAVLAGTAPERSAGVPGEAGPEVLAASPPAPAAARSAPPATGGPDAPAAPAPVEAPGLERLRDRAALASCLSAVLPPGDAAVRPLALDYAAYADQPALVVVLPATDPSKVDVFVVAAGCSASNDATLFFTRLDRPR